MFFIYGNAQSISDYGITHFYLKLFHRTFALKCPHAPQQALPR